MQRKLLVIVSVGFIVTGQLLIMHYAFIKYLRKNWEYNDAMHQLFVDFKNDCDSIRRESCIILSLRLVSQ
jgi:hypothetical protein